jgi:hypothetical protein
MREDLDILSKAMSEECLKCPSKKSFGNSGLSIIVGDSKTQKLTEKRFSILKAWFEVDKFHNLQSNLNYESFIQISLEMKVTRPLYFFMNYMF